MAFRIVMKNPGGELDSQPAKDGADAVAVLSKMIEDCGELVGGDSFEIIDEDDEA